ncbi:cordon-bleu protein-like 1b isoform X2 [Narcine bancroftii]|uniref:cordon-bleu protein-like 1b isoform X2 n=1 Tax=Narcine bancroftii TaxID=1343680 RepID=UPI003832120C
MLEGRLLMKEPKMFRTGTFHLGTPGIMSWVGKRSKPKAPAPPTFSKHVEGSSVAKNQEGESLAMEQKDDVLTSHIDLVVVLPGGVERSTSVSGSKPMMDLLIFLCGKYHLNPSSHTIELEGREKNPVQFKANTLVGTLEVAKVILKEKNVEDKKKPFTVMPEQTVRVVVNYKKTQKTIVRVSPFVPLQDLIPVISNKCEFDPDSTILVKDFESLEAYDLTKSLNELGLREVCAVNTSIGQLQVSGNLNLEKENKGFFHIFRLSKKKWEKPMSAPATPLISPQRPLGMSSSSAYCPTYQSNTLPSDLPKKRRAPAPPKHAAQSLPKESSRQASARPVSCVFSDNALSESAQNVIGPCRQRTGSLPHGEVVTSRNPSLKKKRQAPLPPSKAPDDQKIPDNAKGSDLDSCRTPDAEDVALDAKVSSTLHDDQAVDNLEEIVEMEETRTQDIDAEGVIVQKEETPSPHVTTDHQSKNAQTSVSDSLDVDTSVTIDKETEVKSELRESAAQNIFNQEAVEKDNNSVMENVDKDLSMVNSSVADNEMHPRDSDEMSGTSYKIPSDKGITGTQADVSRDVTASPLPNHSPSLQPTTITVENQQKKSDGMEINEVKFEEVNKTLDFQHAHSTKTLNDTIVPSHDKTLNSISQNLSNPDSNNLSLPMSSQPQNNVPISTKATNPTTQSISNKEDQSVSNQSITEPLTFSPTCGAQYTKDTVGRSESPTKVPIIYKSESEPKPKPSNEITREYIPKIGMTTYKIVPPKSLEKCSSGITSEAETVIQQTPTCDYVPESYPSKQSSNHSNITEGSRASVSRKLTAIHQEALNNMQRSMSIDAETHPPNFKGAISKLAVEYQSEPQKETDIKRTQSASDKKMKPGSAFLQLHKRIPGHYVTSALARSSSLPSQSSLDEAKEEIGAAFQNLSPTNTINGEMIIPPPPEFAGISEESVEKEMSKSGGTSTSRPSQPPKVPKKPSIRVALGDKKGLRTTVVSKAYTPTSPSPFALAVSSAVRKTQTNTMCSLERKHIETNSSKQSSTMDIGNKELHPSFSIPKESSNISNQTTFPEKEIKKDCNDTVAETQPQHIQPQMPSPLINQKLSLASQISDPAETHQALLNAIRSGEGAAKLRKPKTFTAI